MSVKTRGQNFKEKQDSYIVSKYPLQKLCIIMVILTPTQNVLYSSFQKSELNSSTF